MCKMSAEKVSRKPSLSDSVIDNHKLPLQCKKIGEIHPYSAISQIWTLLQQKQAGCWLDLPDDKSWIEWKKQYQKIQ